MMRMKKCAALWVVYCSLHHCVITEGIPLLPFFLFLPLSSLSLTHTQTHVFELM